MKALYLAIGLVVFSSSVSMSCVAIDLASEKNPVSLPLEEFIAANVHAGWELESKPEPHGSARVIVLDPGQFDPLRNGQCVNLTYSWDVLEVKMVGPDTTTQLSFEYKSDHYTASTFSSATFPPAFADRPFGIAISKHLGKKTPGIGCSTFPVTTGPKERKLFGYVQQKITATQKNAFRSYGYLNSFSVAILHKTEK